MNKEIEKETWKQQIKTNMEMMEERKSKDGKTS